MRVYISRMWGEEIPWWNASKFCLVTDIQDVIKCIKFGADQLKGLELARCQSLPFPTDFAGRPYTTLLYRVHCDTVIGAQGFKTTNTTN